MPFGFDDAILGASVLSNLFGGSSAQRRADQSQELNQDIALQDYRARIPLRGMGIDRLLGPQAQRENLNNLFADSGNPYSRVLERPATAQGMPASWGSQVPAGIPNGPGTRNLFDWMQQQTGGTQTPGQQYAASVMPRTLDPKLNHVAKLADLGFMGLNKIAAPDAPFRRGY